jgi:hypothetical protein
VTTKPDKRIALGGSITEPSAETSTQTTTAPTTATTTTHDIVLDEGEGGSDAEDEMEFEGEKK